MPEEVATVWTPANVEELVYLWGVGYTIDEISHTMGRTMQSVEAKVYKLRCKGVYFKARVGNSKEGRKTDRNPSLRPKCMTCQQRFPTSNRNTHICPECLESGLFNGIAAQYA